MLDGYLTRFRFVAIPITTRARRYICFDISSRIRFVYASCIVKAHKNGIKKPKAGRTTSMRGVSLHTYLSLCRSADMEYLTLQVDAKVYTAARSGGYRGILTFRLVMDSSVAMRDSLAPARCVLSLLVSWTCTDSHSASVVIVQSPSGSKTSCGSSMIPRQS